MSSGLYDGGIKELAQLDVSPEHLADPDRRASVDNPFCGDQVDLEITVEAGAGLRRWHNGCAVVCCVRQRPMSWPNPRSGCPRPRSAMCTADSPGCWRAIVLRTGRPGLGASGFV